MKDLWQPVHLKQEIRFWMKDLWKLCIWSKLQNVWVTLESRGWTTSEWVVQFEKKQSVKRFLKMHSGLNWFSQDCKRQNLVLEQFQIVSRTALYISSTTAESFSTNQQRPTFGLWLTSSLTSSARKSQRVPWAAACGRANKNGSIRRRASWRSCSCCMVWAGLRCSEFLRSWASQPCCQATLSVTKDIWIWNTLAARY